MAPFPCPPYREPFFSGDYHRFMDKICLEPTISISLSLMGWKDSTLSSSKSPPIVWDPERSSTIKYGTIRVFYKRRILIKRIPALLQGWYDISSLRHWVWVVVHHWILYLVFDGRNSLKAQLWWDLRVHKTQKVK